MSCYILRNTNTNGVRISKTVDRVEHKYFVEGIKILREEFGSHVLDFLYGVEGDVVGFTDNGTAYYCYKNLQGDVIGITNKDGSLIATYAYDAWGKPISIEGDLTVANLNPIRYRGYYYDTETGLYYLNSRYYDPEICRFINADSVEYITRFQEFEINYFSYCFNDPINNKDLDGQIASYLIKKLAKVILGALVGVAARFFADLVYSAFKARWCFSSISDYIWAAVDGAWDSLWGGGIAKKILGALLVNTISQVVDMIRGKKNFDFVELAWAMFDPLMEIALDRIIKTPKYIRDIKKEAREKGIIGTKKLLKYLSKKIIILESVKFTISSITSAVKRFIADVLNQLDEILSEYMGWLGNIIRSRLNA